MFNNVETLKEHNNKISAKITSYFACYSGTKVIINQREKQRLRYKSRCFGEKIFFVYIL